MSAVQACINQAAYNAFYDLTACALETHNQERAAQRIIESRNYLPQADVNRLVRALEADYYEFT
ncbi:hypothetical protein [Burkholderia oklahomensis]|uniref:Uncharacterized protein n=1 Tax=Burkholderia oklahomensis TaxID=342113 RepID=A0AAI8BC52_9BURK|nr:hypothetical protein [Burkholderia oklahomensis]AIO69396.1 hypothetical protein DM82_4485 [Burkholderia oklahomensis]AJX35899.1 hypothetical protein BG90_6088 [Burkholderia oklahomensis C6786]AOI40003.1 hypothetical protein WG70_10495 [Burkholderia oklahomensis EO147]AOI49667.1 hypothetical protein WI23_28475 [Burkholderia oklahomensis C6786]KUY55695.1 hypothetical protein WI23_20820 [Burkholderia oklahomensis C6786]